MGKSRFILMLCLNTVLCFLNTVSLVSAQADEGKYLIVKWEISKNIDLDADYQSDREFVCYCIACPQANKKLKQAMKILERKNHRIFRGIVGGRCYNKFCIKTINNDAYYVLNDGLYSYKGIRHWGGKRLVKLLDKISNQLHGEICSCLITGRSCDLSPPDVVHNVTRSLRGNFVFEVLFQLVISPPIDIGGYRNVIPSGF